MSHIDYEMNKEYSLKIENKEIKVKGVVNEIEENEYSYIYTLERLVLYKNKKVVNLNIHTRMQIKSESIMEKVNCGNTIIVNGIFSYGETSKNPGAFNQKQYFQQNRILGIIKEESFEKINDNTNIFKIFQNKIKNKISKIFYEQLTQKKAGVLSGIIFGDKTKMSSQTISLFQNAGLAHILVVSGFHISLIGLLFFKGIRRTGAGYLISTLSSLVLLFGYIIVAGFGISSKRAFIMFGVYLISQVTGRTYDLLTGIAICILIETYQEPWIICSVSFQLSYSAVFFIGLWQMRTEIIEIKRKKANHILGLIWLQLGLFPIICYYFYQIQCYSIIANILVEWLIPFVFAGTIAGSIFYFCFPVVSDAIFAGLDQGIEYIFAVAKIIEKIPGNQWIMGKPDMKVILLYYIIFAVLFLFMVTNKMKWMPLLIAILFCVLSIKLHKGLTIWYLNVGQGDGIFIWGPEAKTYFIDGGSSDISKLGQYQILPFLKSYGIKNIDYWFVTHLDEDHISGLRDLFSLNYSVEKLFLPKVKEKNEIYLEIVNLAKKSGTKVYYIYKGMEFKEEDLTLQCIYPDSNITIAESSNNESSTVMWLKYKDFQGLFLGDISAEQEEIICKEEKEIKNINVLKVAHHGSKYSSSQAFLETVKPQISIISCSKSNRYGHPHIETIQRLYQIGSKVLITYKNGAVKIKWN